MVTQCAGAMNGATILEAGHLTYCNYYIASKANFRVLDSLICTQYNIRILFTVVLCAVNASLHRFSCSHLVNPRQ